MVETDGLCPTCWRDTQFNLGLACALCGSPLIGQSDEEEHCDDCLRIPRPWKRGWAAIGYQDTGRKLVLGLKHGDRHDVVGPAAGWMRRRMGAIDTNAILVPVPLHWTRLLRRRYNQSALLAKAIAKEVKATCIPDALIRTKRTPMLDGKGRDERFATLSEAIIINPRRTSEIAGRNIIVIDDVMTTGATLTACTDALLAAGAITVSISILARVANAP